VANERGMKLVYIQMNLTSFVRVGAAEDFPTIFSGSWGALSLGLAAVPAESQSSHPHFLGISPSKFLRHSLHAAISASFELTLIATAP
jgi:hypothetical protein